MTWRDAVSLCHCVRYPDLPLVVRVFNPGRHALPAVDVDGELLGPDVLEEAGPGGHQLGPGLTAELQLLLESRESVVESQHLAGQSGIGLVSALLHIRPGYSLINPSLGQLKNIISFYLSLSLS